jgi:hypothetical protein
VVNFFFPSCNTLMFGTGTKLLQQAERINRKFEQDIIKEV